MIDLTNILGKNENHLIEAKSAKGGFPDSFWETYSAFANTDGGTILLGVEETNDHRLYMQDGLKDVEKTKDTFWNLVNNRQKISHNIMTNSMVYPAKLEGKDILVVEVPRAERMIRPVYKGQDPRGGTFQRWGEGDHLCSGEEISAMLRDASSSPLDAQPIKEMDMSVFCEESVDGYRNVFKSTNPHHIWNKLDNEMFLRRIKAVAMADDGCYHPTEAGLLMFGYEYEITSRFPQYFLDYQEDRVMVGVTRWKDRITSTSGDWSGNLFDFTFKVLPKLQSDLKVPFVLKGMQRVDDTPVHKILREAVVNTLTNADYWGRRGVVISKNKDGFTFANPGGMRISKTEAIEGGVSDPRNSTILKFFSLIRFGERAGSGLNGIMQVWKKVYHTEANISETQDEVARTVLTLPFDGHEQDVDAMLELYDDPDELIFGEGDDKTVRNDSMDDKSGDKMAVKKEIIVRLLGQRTDKPSDNADLLGQQSNKLPDNTDLLGQKLDKPLDNIELLGQEDMFDRLSEVVLFLQSNPESSKKAIVEHTGWSESSIKRYLQRLVDIEMVIPHGANKNRTYSIKK